MRSIKLAGAVALMAIAIATTAGGASAVRLHVPHAGRSCHVNLNVAPHLITAGESVLAYGHMQCPTGSLEVGQTVTLYQRAAGTTAVKTVGTTSTDTHGLYQIPAASITSDTYFHVTAGPVKSGEREVLAAALVGLAGPPEGAQLLTANGPRQRNTVTFTGTVSPSYVGATVVLQRENAIKGTEWRRIDIGTVGAGGVFSITHAFRVAGDANIRVVVHGERRNLASASNVLTYEVSQVQNPLLTIHSSSDPIPYGGSVTFSGVASGEPNTLLTLEARTALQSSNVAMAQVRTNAAGAYSFPAQSPLDSTNYKVRSAARVSAILYQGVKTVLTASASATSVQVGQPVTFSGTVAPDHTGHTIYLEKQNLSGTGYYVIALGTVGPGSVYSITRTFYGVGTSIVRVKVPGDPLNGGAASQLFTLHVASVSSLSTLTPETPGNASLPPTGQL